MIKGIFLTCLSLSAVVMMCSCSKGKLMNPDTPLNTGILLNHAISNENYEDFNDLFSDGRKNYISKDDFQKLVDISKTSSGGQGYTLFEVITLENGEMFLVRLTPKDMNGKYEVEDVILIPKEMKEFFLK